MENSDLNSDVYIDGTPVEQKCTDVREETGPDGHKKVTNNYYYADGLLHLSVVRVDGFLKNQREYNMNGVLSKELSVEKGQNGSHKVTERHYYSSGKIEKENIFEDGKFKSRKYYDEKSGLLTDEFNDYNDVAGFLSRKEYDNKGKLTKEVQYHTWGENKADVAELFAADDALRNLECHEGSRLKKNTLYSPDGNKELARYYHDGDLAFDIHYYKNGQRESLCCYNHSGYKNGCFFSWHENGQLHEVGSYGADVKVGDWLTYDTNGQFLSRESYNTEGKLVDVSKSVDKKQQANLQEILLAASKTR